MSVCVSACSQVAEVGHRTKGAGWASADVGIGTHCSVYVCVCVCVLAGGGGGVEDEGGRVGKGRQASAGRGIDWQMLGGLPPAKAPAQRAPIAPAYEDASTGVCVCVCVFLCSCAESTNCACL